MADTDSFIVDCPLPEALSAEKLKSAGIAMLQHVAGNVWTNFNDSDPGVTILDQLCYALTELGYCGQFPIEDILTRENGEIRYHDQFFTPQDILTSSPVTTDDYRKLILDAVPEIRAFYVEAEKITFAPSQQPCATGRYISHFCLKENPNSRIEPSQLIGRIQIFLNRHRNLGEYFLPPVVLKPREIELLGCVTLVASADVGKVRARIISALEEYAAPVAIQSGYTELLDAGVSPDLIFNGPKLQHGWMAGPAAFQGKRQHVRLPDLCTLIADAEGVLSVEMLNFPTQPEKTEATSEIRIEKDEIPVFVLADNFVFLRSNVAVTPSQGSSGQHHLELLSAIRQSTSISANVDLYPVLPQGKYRAIEEYYSVQNTFPDIYGIGLSSWRSGAANYRSAQSRQLQGYLMPFDQLLANEFSQLAHIDTLFSFADPPVGHETGATAGIPHRKFATTYFCQPLYDIPDVKPLLLGNDAFHFQYDSSRPEREVEAEAWKNFCEFPFNEYLYGLHQCVESDTDALIRRDAMLSHLMARHGDDAGLYDEMVTHCQWFGGELKTRIIAKTIWLQNFGLLSYHRARAFDLSSCATLPDPGDPQLARAMPGSGAALPDAGDAKRKRQPWWRRSGYPEIDGEVDQRRIYAAARLTPADFRRFSAFELKAGILLGLPVRWQMLAGILRALLDDPGFGTWLKQTAGTAASFSLLCTDISVKRAVNGPDQVFEGAQCLMEIARPPDGYAQAADYQGHADQLLWLSSQTKGFLLLESVLLWADETSIPSDAGVSPFLNAWLFFPGYITLSQSPAFGEFLKTLLDCHWPAQVAVSYLNLSYEAMRTLICAWVKRNNSFNDAVALKVASEHLGAQVAEWTNKGDGGMAT